MIRPIHALVLAAALVLAPPVPRAEAQAGDDFLGLLLGIGLVHAIGKGIEQARAPQPPRPRPAAAPVPRACAFDLMEERRGPGAACFARRPDAPEEAWHGTPHWYGADRIRP